jgi:hypothetical protein
MDGAFACPECGSSVQVHGLAPGRQVRCEFCHRLLEVPYLPRAADPSWKRRRFGRPKWVRWAWVVLGIAAVMILVTGSIRFLRKHHDSALKRSIQRLLETSRQHENAGDLNQALIELDAAMDLARQSNPAGISQLAEYQTRRRSLAQREVEATLERLVHRDQSSFTLGDWLNLIARLPHDPDLAPLVDPIDKQFAAALRREADAQLRSAIRLFDSGQAVESSKRCDQIASLIKHLEPEVQSTLRSETEKLMSRIVTQNGVTIKMLRGTFAFGSQTSYVADLWPILLEALEARGYLPDRQSSPWHGLWSHASYQLSIDVTERLEGSYMSSQNRLSRIEVKVLLTFRGDLLWQTQPSARSSEALPELSTFVASRVAAKQTRSEEIEKLLYANARGQVEDRFKRNLGSMPPLARAR